MHTVGANGLSQLKFKAVT